MNYLAIDTSTSHASVALAVGETVYSITNDEFRDHAKRLLPMIEQLLTQADVSLNALDGIVFGRGPGSFTGLRIACSVVKGLAYPHDLPVYPVSSLAAVAEEVFHSEQPIEEARVLTIIDARMHEVYWDCYSYDGGHVEERVSPISTLALAWTGPLILAGAGFEDYLSQLPEVIQRQCIEQRSVLPSAEAMIRIVRAGRCTPVSAGEALPVYVRNQVVQGASGG